MSVLSANQLKRLSFGFPVLDDVFPGFEAGDFAVFYGVDASFFSFVLCVRCVMSPHMGGLGLPVVFVDGGNSFNPYLVAEISRGYGLDPRYVLEKIYVSRAFTVYQLSSLIIERLESLVDEKKPGLIVVLDIASLYFDRDIPKTEAKDLFVKVCAKLSEIISGKRAVVLATYRPDRASRRGVFIEAVLLGRANTLVKFERRGGILRFALQDHPRIKPFSIGFSLDDVLLTKYLEV